MRTARPASSRPRTSGPSPGNFSAALGGRVGPFLKWNPADAPAAPAGYIGDPGVLHTVTGSPYGTNYIKVEQKNPDGTYTLIGQWNNLFSLQGRLAVNSGVDVDAAYFTGNDTGGFLDVYASSDAGQAIVVSANAALGTPATPMREMQGRYYARIAVNQKIPAGTQIEVVNTGDKPVAKKTFTIQDQVAITSATYNADTQDLTVQATTTDLETGADTPDPDRSGFGSTLPVPLVNGQATFPNVTAPPPVVKVTSSAGGSDTSTLTTSGAGFGALAPVAQFATPLTVQVGQPVPLDGTASIGTITSYAWTTNNGTFPGCRNPALTTWTPDTSTRPRGHPDRDRTRWHERGDQPRERDAGGRHPGRRRASPDQDPRYRSSPLRGRRADSRRCCGARSADLRSRCPAPRR